MFALFHITVVQDDRAALAAFKSDILAAINALQEIVMAVSKETQDLLDEVTQLKTTEQSVVALLNGFADRLESNIDDKPALQALLTDLRSIDTDMHDAVVKNTPADPATSAEQPG